MEEKKSVLDNNQVENSEGDFRFSEGMIENMTNNEVKYYRRDFMLQLRLHPLSLQKPKDLPNMDVIKEKLYLLDINDSSSPSADRRIDMLHASTKSDYCNIKHDYSLSQLSRMFPYCFSSHMYNGAYSSVPSSKYRTPFHTYCNPLKKHSNPSHQFYKDFGVDESLWPKRCYTSSEDMWTCYPSHAHTNFNKMKEELEAVPKSKKKLPIINPLTGENVLDGFAKSPDEQQKDALIVDENFESKNLKAESSPNDIGDCFSEDLSEALVTDEVYNDSAACTSNESNVGFHELKNGQIDLQNSESPKETSKSPVVLDDSKLSSNAEKEENPCSNKQDVRIHSSAIDGNLNKDANCAQKIQDEWDAHKKQLPKAFQNKETNPLPDVHTNCQGQHRKEYNFHMCKENAKMDESMKESFKQLREKIYVIRQEEQKMIILQSFLRYKKYQLEESARNLDEKRIEIANWECNLYNKAKRLQDREQWLENKSEILYNKALQLAEKEKILNKEENKFLNELQPSKNSNNFPDKKFSFDNCSDLSWEGVRSRNKDKGDSEYTYFGYQTNSSKVIQTSPLNVEKCQSHADSLDELEKNIVLMEKMHSSGETREGDLENKPEPAIQKKGENLSSEPLGQSKGRRYLPEHIKYWLNNKDKNAS